MDTGEGLLKPPEAEDETDTASEMTTTTSMTASENLAEQEEESRSSLTNLPTSLGACLDKKIHFPS